MIKGSFKNKRDEQPHNQDEQIHLFLYFATVILEFSF